MHESLLERREPSEIQRFSSLYGSRDGSGPTGALQAPISDARTTIESRDATSNYPVGGGGDIYVDSEDATSSYDIYEDLLKGRQPTTSDWIGTVGSNSSNRPRSESQRLDQRDNTIHKRRISILNLPSEVMDLVLDYACTSCSDLIRLGVTNRSLLHTSRTTRLWRQLPATKRDTETFISRLYSSEDGDEEPPDHVTTVSAAQCRERFLHYSYIIWKAKEEQRQREQLALKYESTLVYCKTNRRFIRSVFIGVAFVTICMWGLCLGARSIRLRAPLYLHLGIVGLYVSCLSFPAWCVYNYILATISRHHPSSEISQAFTDPEYTAPMVTACVCFGVGVAFTILLGHIKIAVGERSTGPISNLSWSLTMMPLYVISIIISMTIGVQIAISEFRKPDSARTVLATFVALFVGGTLAVACALITYRQDELDGGRDQPYGVAECLAPVLFHICCVFSHSLYLILAMRKRLKVRFHLNSTIALLLELVAIASLGTILLLSFDPYFAWTTDYNYWFYVAVILACKIIALVFAHAKHDYLPH